MTEPWGLSQRYFHRLKIQTLLQPKLDHCFLTSWILVWIWQVSCVVYRRLGPRDVMCSLHLCLCSLDNCSLGNYSQNCTDTKVLTNQRDASAIYASCRHSFLEKWNSNNSRKGLFWHEKGIFCSFEWNWQGCQNAYTFLHSQPDQLIKKATESDEIQNGNKMYHDICLITACSANSSSDWKRKKSEKEMNR